MNDDSRKASSLRRLYALGLSELSRQPTVPRYTLADIARDQGIGLLGSPQPATRGLGLIEGAMLRESPRISPPRTPLTQAIARKLNKQSHDSILKTLARSLAANAFDGVTADLEGWPTPAVIKWVKTGEGHRPDAWATCYGTQYIFEVETAETIAIEHTRSQCELFSAHANQVLGKFVMVVPHGEADRARRQLALWNITGDVW